MHEFQSELKISSTITLKTRSYYRKERAAVAHKPENSQPIINEIANDHCMHWFIRFKMFRVHSQKRHRFGASCGFHQPDALCQQVVSSLLTSSNCIKSVNIRQLDICRLAVSWWNNLHQACIQFATCSKSVNNL